MALQSGVEAMVGILALGRLKLSKPASDKVNLRKTAAMPENQAIP